MEPTADTIEWQVRMTRYIVKLSYPDGNVFDDVNIEAATDTHRELSVTHT